MIIAAASFVLHALALMAAAVAGGLSLGDEDDLDKHRRCSRAAIAAVVLALIGWAIR